MSCFGNYFCKFHSNKLLFRTKDYRKRHQVTHLSDADQYKYRCTFCEQKFKWLTSLQVHQAIHNQDKALVECNVCYKQFSNQRVLERHQKIHKNVKFKCMLCHKVVSHRKDNIRRHIRHIHTDLNRSEIGSKIQAFEDETPGVDEIEESDESVNKTVEIESPPAPVAIVNNKVKVIQTVGDPSKHQRSVVDELQTPPEKSIVDETKLPPKEQPIVFKQPTLSQSVDPPTKPKYDPIQHYRKMLLGSFRDDPVIVEDNNEEADNAQEEFPDYIHWRKRTSQNFLFRR